MKRVRNKYLALLLGGLVIGLVVLWIGAHRSAPFGTGNGLVVSRPVFGNRTNSTGATPTVSFRVSNAGPKGVDLRVDWFECRAKRDRTRLATNQLASVNIPLSPRSSTNLTFDIRPTMIPIEEWLCCCQVGWVERWTGLRLVANRLNNWMQLRLNIALFEPKALNSGLIYASNVDVAEYFRFMYGWIRGQPMDTLIEQQSPAPESTPFPARFGTPYPSLIERQSPAPESTAPKRQVRFSQNTEDEEAESAFLWFSPSRESKYNSVPSVEPGTSPNAAPPHR